MRNYWVAVTFYIIVSAAYVNHLRQGAQPYPDWWYGAAGVFGLFAVLLITMPYIAELGAKHGREARWRREKR